MFNLGQYNAQLLELFPKTQYWVNISVAYREKMIPLCVSYQGVFWFVFMTTIEIFIKDWLGIKKMQLIAFTKELKKYLMVFYIFL